MKYSLFWCLTLFASVLLIPSAQARIDIVPQKIIIENRERGGEFTILNLIDQESTFRISLLNFEQNQDGVYKKLDTPLNPAFDPDKIVRFTPKQFTLPPGGKQKIRLSLRKPAELPPGEYRFHVKAMQFAQKDDLKRDPNAKSVQLVMNTGITIPVIVRHGETSVSAKLGNPKIVPATQTETKKPELHMPVNREGNASAIGMLQVFWQPTGEQPRRIGRITNLNVFTDIASRNIKLPLTEAPQGSGTLRIRFLNKDGRIYDEISVEQ